MGAHVLTLFTHVNSGNGDTGASTDTDQPPRIAHKSASVDTSMAKSGGDDIRDKGREMLLNSFKKYGKCATGIDAN